MAFFKQRLFQLFSLLLFPPLVVSFPLSCYLWTPFHILLFPRHGLLSSFIVCINSCPLLLKYMQTLKVGSTHEKEHVIFVFELGLQIIMFSRYIRFHNFISLYGCICVNEHRHMHFMYKRGEGRRERKKDPGCVSSLPVMVSYSPRNLLEEDRLIFSVLEVLAQGWPFAVRHVVKTHTLAGSPGELFLTAGRKERGEG